MIKKRKKKEPSVIDNYYQNIEKNIKALRDFRGRGETFLYLGITMIVTGYWEASSSAWGGIYPGLTCDYKDRQGVIRKKSFSVGDLPMLKVMNPGFALIELLTCLAIVGILAAIAIPEGLKFMARVWALKGLW